ncbi:hypothetical protein BU16DRAFT_545206 [Lophium mytilinum]|uniref:Uncharacterized protein n=1 Tax=Lophium mytilinum TaxID=390894 RepID=A0A6A6QAW4_9PEZI|nr:hypothetical protein BU16DRAFT_545206 [Lophium mytilinum]
MNSLTYIIVVVAPVATAIMDNLSASDSKKYLDVLREMPDDVSTLIERVMNPLAFWRCGGMSRRLTIWLAVLARPLFPVDDQEGEYVGMDYSGNVVANVYTYRSGPGLPKGLADSIFSLPPSGLANYEKMSARGVTAVQASSFSKTSILISFGKHTLRTVIDIPLVLTNNKMHASKTIIRPGRRLGDKLSMHSTITHLFATQLNKRDFINLMRGIGTMHANNIIELYTSPLMDVFRDLHWTSSIRERGHELTILSCGLFLATKTERIEGVTTTREIGLSEIANLHGHTVMKKTANMPWNLNATIDY